MFSMFGFTIVTHFTISMTCVSLIFVTHTKHRAMYLHTLRKIKQAESRWLSNYSNSVDKVMLGVKQYYYEYNLSQGMIQTPES